MLITKLTIQDFRSHQNTELSLEPFTVIRGPNGAGKTTVEQAIEYLLCGRTEATGAGGQGAAELIRSGADKAIVDADFVIEGHSYQSRARLSASGKRDSAVRRADQKWSEASSEMTERFSTARDVLSCLINNRYFVDLKPAEQKRVLGSIVLPSRYDWPEAAKAQLNQVAIRPDWSLAPFEFVESAYKAVYEARTIAKRDLANLRVPEGAAPAPDTAEIRSKLGTLQKELGDLNRKQAEQAKAPERRAKQVESATKRQAQAEMALQAESQSLAGQERALLSAKELKELRIIAGKAAEAKAMEERYSSIIAEQRVCEAQAMAADELENAVCPTCKQAVSEAALATLVAPIKDRYEALARERSGIIAHRKAVGDVDAAARRVAEHEAAEDETRRIKARVAKLETEYKGATEDLAQLGPEPMFNDLSGEIDALNARIANGQQVLEQAAAAASVQKHYEELKRQRAVLKGRLKALESLADYFGPDGIKAELISQHVGGFQSSINAVLGRWGYRCSLSVEPYGFAVKRAGSDAALGLHLLSRSERYRFSVAFQVALAIVSGWRFVVVDEADVLDQASRQEFNRALMQAGLDQVIILATDERVEAPSLPGATFIRLETGEEGVTQSRVLSQPPATEVMAVAV